MATIQVLHGLEKFEGNDEVRTTQLNLLISTQSLSSATEGTRDVKTSSSRVGLATHGVTSAYHNPETGKSPNLTSGDSRSSNYDSGGVSKTIILVSSSISSSLDSASSFPSCVVPVLTRNNAEMPFGDNRHPGIATFGVVFGFASEFCNSGMWEDVTITSGINGSSIFDFTGCFHALSYPIDRCEDAKQTSHDSGSQLTMCKGILFLAYPISSIVQPTLNKGLQLADIFICQKYCDDPLGLVQPDTLIGFEK